MRKIKLHHIIFSVELIFIMKLIFLNCFVFVHELEFINYCRINYDYNLNPSEQFSSVRHFLEIAVWYRLSVPQTWWECSSLNTTSEPASVTVRARRVWCRLSQQKRWSGAAKTPASSPDVRTPECLKCNELAIILIKICFKLKCIQWQK